MSIQSTLAGTGLPVAYGYHRKKVELPYLVYMGDGQNQYKADNTRYYHKNQYRVELYFKFKNEEVEEELEEALLSNGFLFDKSEDTYITTEDTFVIYYYVRQ